MEKKKILVGMSGGVDSAVAALLLKKNFDVTGLTLRLWSDQESLPDSENTSPDENVADAKKIADILSIPHISLSLGESFRKTVIENFICEYRSGKTPNPCVICNKEIKFGRMLQLAKDKGYDLLATGHYAKIVKNSNNGFELRRASDKTKDQTYFLWSIDKNALSSIVLPLGDHTKSEIRTIAAQNGFCNAERKDSQDICFIKNSDYAAFLAQYDSPTFKQGSFVDINGKILGAHAGLEKYTIGQRKGLGIALGHPMFVCKKDPVSGDVTLCDDKELYRRELTASALNLLTDADLSHPERFSVKIRYRHNEAPAEVVMIGEHKIKVVFDEPQRAICSGQSVVLYDGDTVIGGAVID